MKQKKLIGLIVLIIAALGCSFYGGMRYADIKRISSGAEQSGQGRQLPMGRGQNGTMDQGGQQSGPGGKFGNGGGMIPGQIIAKDDKSFTIKSQDGGSRIIFYSDKTVIGKSNKAVAADLAIGQSVVVSGRPSPDGSVSAQDVQIKSTE